jgi:hypothetical protein
MDLSEKLKEENIDLNDKEKVQLLQRFYQTGFDAGMHATHKNIEYNVMFAQVMPQLIEFFNMTSNPIQLQQLSDILKHLKEYKAERGYL